MTRKGGKKKGAPSKGQARGSENVRKGGAKQGASTGVRKCKKSQAVRKGVTQYVRIRKEGKKWNG